ncbi:MAG: NADH-quinone oxidoreductase subunit H [Firmicutes bacterium]|nr:NADH-quinone oxidoreductase subunit H [Bacillota bacterium]
MKNIFPLIFTVVNLLIIPLLLTGVIRKVKALMQNRIGAPVLQPFYDVAKFLSKSETISKNTSWVFTAAPIIGLSVAFLAGALFPWSGSFLPGKFAAASNIFLLIYLLALGKFFSMLAAMDTGSAFGGLGASREATISMMVEPIVITGLGALCLNAGTPNLQSAFAGNINPIIAGLTGTALIIASLAELSRIPVDDPTTHLELTMVHEAMILENSGRNLALIEYTTAIRSCIFYGLTTQVFFHMLPFTHSMNPILQYAAGIAGVLLFGCAVAFAEGILVKLKWRNVPNFLTFGTVLSLLAALIAVTQR